MCVETVHVVCVLYENGFSVNHLFFTWGGFKYARQGCQKTLENPRKPSPTLAIFADLAVLAVLADLAVLGIPRKLTSAKNFEVPSAGPPGDP